VRSPFENVWAPVAGPLDFPKTRKVDAFTDAGSNGRSNVIEMVVAADAGARRAGSTVATLSCAAAAVATNPTTADETVHR